MNHGVINGLNVLKNASQNTFVEDLLKAHKNSKNKM